MRSRRSQRGVEQYATSPIKDLNDARSLASRLRPLRLSDPDGPAYGAKARVCTLQDLVDRSPKSDELCGVGDSHLLLADDLNPGYYRRKPLYDYSDKKVGEVYICDVHEGAVALHPDTLLYWA